MSSFETIFANGGLTEFILKNINDPWENTLFAGYVHMSPKQKGELGERFATELLKNAGHTVLNAPTSTSGFDRFVDNKKCEIKFSLAMKNRNGGTNRDSFMINHVSKNKSWDFLLFIGINENEQDMRILWFTKEDFTNNLSTSPFNVQQGGKKEDKSIENDDFMCTNIPRLMECEWVHGNMNSLKTILFS